VTRTAWLLALVLGIGVLTATPAAAWEPNSGATFNVPAPWGTNTQRYRIIRTIEKAIDETPGRSATHPNPTINVATFLLDRGLSVDALIRACNRGVSVRVIMDGDIDTVVSKNLIRALNSDNVVDADGDGQPDAGPTTGPCNTALPGEPPPPTGTLTDAQAEASVAAPTDESVTWGSDRSYAKMCQGSCRGAGGNMHSKFYLFSETGTAKDVVMVSSANMNRGGANNGWNDLYVMKDATLYDGYKSIHREMTEDTQAGDGKREIRSGAITSRFFPMENATEANDPTMQDLRQVSCRSAFGATRIYVSMFYWQGDRGDYLADKLLSLAHHGCKVSVIYGAPSVAIAGKLRTAARAGVIHLWDSRWDMDHDGYNEVRTHAKYVLVKGSYAGDTSSWQVWTGSANWVAGSLSKGDETTLNIARKSAYDDYLADWTAIRKHSRQVPARR
jgi:hypothetical protein